ncbi:uncharacterized protein LDX57_003371 [Aspergillus melleus]|uniref:uncharacterized protein n=1 Tax=Aspergillus melleus TaxID=138277 RepID=UPI001E8E0B90|nr:uncharacterized protein LDX57_003371 [Aspergillus melleus]KAH8425622.1 hypothetical protein LDX57_003371 [Aspergillus melleus]
MASPIPKTIAIIAGAGPGTGAAIARRFAQTYPVVLLARSQTSLDPLVREIDQTKGKGSALGIPTDVTDPQSVESTMTAIKTHYGADLNIAAAVFNVASKFVRKPFLESEGEEFLGSLEGTARGAFQFARAVLPLMRESQDGKGQGQGQEYPSTLIFTGATASLKGGSGLGSFAMSKFAVRAMAQSLAREFGPKGIHVAHAVIDGIIDIEKTKGFMDDRPDAKIDPNWVGDVELLLLLHDKIAEAYWFLHTQPKSAFTQELDLRPHAETW